MKKALNDYTDIHTSMDVTNKRRKQLKIQIKKEEDRVVELKKVVAFTLFHHRTKSNILIS